MNTIRDFSYYLLPEGLNRVRNYEPLAR